MKSKSFQQLEDFYVNLGFSGEKLRKVLAKDKEYKKLLNEREQKLTKKFNIKGIEKKNYVMSTDYDYEILSKCAKLAKFNLSREDMLLVKLIKTQLKHDWRTPLIKTLNNLIKKYK